MSIEEIITELEKEAEEWGNMAESGCARTDLRKLWKEKADVLLAAIDLLKTNPEAQPNEPLTLEELRGMDGQPVWLDRGPGYGGHCVLVQVWAKSTNIIYLIQANGSVLHLEVEIDNGAKFYRRPPKED